eukprot:2771639-Amphidinium_carterae.1
MERSQILTRPHQGKDFVVSPPVGSQSSLPALLRRASMPSAEGPPLTRGFGPSGALRGLSCIDGSPCQSLFQA